MKSHWLREDISVTSMSNKIRNAYIDPVATCGGNLVGRLPAGPIISKGTPAPGCAKASGRTLGELGCSLPACVLQLWRRTTAGWPPVL